MYQNGLFILLFSFLKPPPSPNFSLNFFAELLSLSLSLSLNKLKTLMLCLEVLRERRVVERRVEGNGYPLPYLDEFR